MNTIDKLKMLNTPQNRTVFFFLVMLFIMNFINKIDFNNDPVKKMYLICTYCTVQGITLLCIGIIYLRIKSKNEKGLIHIKNTGMIANAQAAVDKENHDTNEVITQTIMEYDMSKVKQMFANSALTVAFTGFLYYKFNIIRPLAIQSIFAVKNLLEQPLVSIHIFGKPATGSLARPFRSSNPLAPQEQMVTDKEVKRMEKKKN